MTRIFRAGQVDYIDKMNVIGSEYANTDVSAVIAGTTYLDCSLSANFYVNMGAGNTTIAFTNIPTGTDNTGYRIVVYIVQDGTGSRTVSWPGTIVWPAGTAPTLTTTANKIDIFEFRTLNSGSKFFGATVALNYA
jgi:hypothetical protein